MQKPPTEQQEPQQPQQQMSRRQTWVWLAHFLSLANVLCIAFAVNRWGVVSQIILLVFAVFLYLCIIALMREHD